MVSFRRKNNVNVMRVAMKLVGTIIALYATGYMMNVIGDVMLNTSSAYYRGLTLIGWTIGSADLNGSGTELATGCGHTLGDALGERSTTCITATNGSGILAIVGLLAIVWILFEFVDVRM